MGKDEYPSDLTSAYSLMVNYKTPTNKPQHKSSSSTGPLSPPLLEPSQLPPVPFAQKQAHIPGSDGLLHPTITCFHCQQTGDYASTCPTPSQTPPVASGTTLLQFVLAQATSTPLSPHCILLDSQSTISV
jgi:hypothetical protein